MVAGVIRHLENVIEMDTINLGMTIPRNRAHERQILNNKAAQKVFHIVDLWRRFIHDPVFAAAHPDLVSNHTAIARRGMELVRDSAPAGAVPVTYVQGRVNAGIDMYLNSRTMNLDGSVRANRVELTNFLMGLAVPMWRRRHALAAIGRMTVRRSSSGRRRSGSSGRRSSRRSGSSGRRRTGSH
jgi:hypothetical protein